MATPDINKIRVDSALVTGAIFVAPSTVALPTDGTTSLAADYKCLGYTSEDGITITESATNNSLRVWEGLKEVLNIRTEYTEQVRFTPVECNADVAKFLWGSDAVTVSAGGDLTIKHHGKTLDPVNIVIEVVPFKGAVGRYCATAQLTERGDVTGNGQDFAGREATLNCIADSNGVTLTEYICFVTGATGTTI